mgnify:FL=1
MNKIVFFFCLFFHFTCQAAEYVSLKYDQVNLRTGPGERFPIDWVYQEKNYPMEVLDSFESWRQVREVDGTIGWISKNMLSHRRYALIRNESPLLTKAEPESEVRAVLQPGVVAQIEECPKGNYCRLKVKYGEETYKGWFLRSDLWGVDKGEEID